MSTREDAVRDLRLGGPGVHGTSASLETDRRDFELERVPFRRIGVLDLHGTPAIGVVVVRLRRKPPACGERYGRDKRRTPYIAVRIEHLNPSVLRMRSDANGESEGHAPRSLTGVSA